jgi:ABC-type multidrug transport system fused ATPase/permease subunit
MNPEKAKMSLAEAVIAMFVVFLLSAIFTFLRTAMFTLSGERIVADLRRSLFASIMKQEIGFFDVNRTGELINRLSSDATVLQQAVTVNISMGLRFGIQVVGGFFVLFYLSWRLTLVMLAIFPLIAVAAWVYGKYIRAYSKEVQDRLADGANVAEETISSIRTVRAFAAEYKEIDRYSARVNQSYEAARKRAIAEAIFAAAATLIANFAIAGVLWYGGSLVLSGEMTVGDLTGFILYTLTVAMSFGGLSALYGDLMKAVGASERVFFLMDRVPQVPFEGGQRVTRDLVEGSVRFDHVDFAYPSRMDQVVLTGTNSL